LVSGPLPSLVETPPLLLLLESRWRDPFLQLSSFEEGNKLATTLPLLAMFLCHLSP